MKKLLLVTCLATAITACGGDKKTNNPVTENPTPPVVEDPVTPEEPTEETREEMIERVLNLPPEPNTSENNSTIVGVDVNENNIRDDVERKIAFEFYENTEDMKRHMHYAELWTLSIKAGQDNDGVKASMFVEQSYLNIMCDQVSSNYTELNESVDDLLTNNFDRRLAVLKADKLAGVVKTLPSKESAIEYCSQFSN